MSKQKFNKIVRHYYDLSKEDRMKLETLVNEYPYSQALHILLAKAHNDANTAEAQTFLHKAAMYTSDRSVLREIMASISSVESSTATTENDGSIMDNLAELKKQKAELLAADDITTVKAAKSTRKTPAKTTKPTAGKTTGTKSAPAKKTAASKGATTTKSAAKSSAVKKTTTKRSTSTTAKSASTKTTAAKASATKSATTRKTSATATRGTGTTRAASKKTATVSSAKKAEAKTAKTTPAKKTATKTSAAASKTAKSVTTGKAGTTKATGTRKTASSSARSTTTTATKAKTAAPKSGTTKSASAKTKKPASKSTTAKTTARKTSSARTTKKTTASRAKKPTDSEDSDQGVKKKTELTDHLANPKVKRQRKIIKEFIKKEPSLVHRYAHIGLEQEDLSIDSTRLPEDLISENLAQILFNQGKTDKAIEIYRKLIWKFPQKKAYFAARIEELTK